MSLTDEQSRLMTESAHLRAVAAAREASLREAEAKVAALQGTVTGFKESFQCNICMSNDCDTVLVPCGHTLCGECAGRLRDSRCPFDRQRFTTHCKFFKPA